MNSSEQTPIYLILNGIILLLFGIKLLFTPILEFKYVTFNLEGYNVMAGMIFEVTGLVLFYGYFSNGKDIKN